MKALVKAKAEIGLWQEERPVPEIGPEDVLITRERGSSPEVPPSDYPTA